MRRLVAFASLVLTIVAAGCGGGDDPTAPSNKNEPALGPSFATSSNGAGVSITTDKDDYAPGDTVWFTGAGWQQGDTLDVVLTDDPQTHEPHTWFVAVDQTGGFRDSTYVVDIGDVGVTFTLTATSRSGGQTLTVTFTDANVSVKSNLLGVSFTVTHFQYSAAGCLVANLTSTTPNVPIDFSGSNFSVFGGGAQQPKSIKFKASALSDHGAAFVNWTFPADPNVAYTAGSDEICVSGNTTVTLTANYNAAPDLAISKALNGSFGVGSPGGTYTITVTNNGTASATSAVGNQITVTDVLPAGLSFASGGGTNNWQACTVSAQTVTCRLAPNQSIAPGATNASSFSIVVNVSQDACPSVNNSASVAGGTPAESNTGNNATGNVATSISSGCVTPNQPPTANAGGPYSGNEGSAIQLDGSGSTDADGTIASYQWTLGTFTPGGAGGGSCSFVGSSTVDKPSVSCNDNGTLAVSLVVTDDDGASSTNTAQATVTVSNVNPLVTITAPSDYSVWAITAPEFGLAAFVNSSFTDAGTNDTHSCTIDWGDGDGPVTGTLTETAGSGTCKSISGNPYTDDGAGIYEVTVTVTDDDNGPGTASVTVIVYDPSAGFVTGGGWINSLAGYCKKAGCQDAEGRAHFGFVSKYQKGANVPTGQTEFQFQAGDLNFHSGLYEWLIVNKDGTNAQYKGSGTINGVNDAYGNPFKFMLWGYDGTKVGGYDTFRIRIWSEVNGYEDVIYDNSGTGTGGYSTVGIASGSIQVQTGGKK
jgi:uncharacterized repeat protein (TIGR01451 family)